MIHINGSEIAAATLPLLTYLQERGFRTDRIAVELNGAIVKRGDYAATLLKDGDTAEIVHFVGGG
ncbi:sulfur carrier protein ThiS [Megasphaera vaginalis (ex Srinivasan et al. 2021)]|uniref:Thiamine biosynthesis protein ThiS n=1 Tax=Megasphaera vaginalis (ex Srinivasan et al. 2021) TaxID=1111454 RepID=U7UIG0_9FIRM|nr:sulfur carrier protein ThiS [Megasphaera vaginalis (ex Srinivasan et al. 2021)]ERT59197.1 thiamine biosynthesis protein ThiS [Megasphaera vaginalis (ex Srinivasan et al. 2021)]